MARWSVALWTLPQPRWYLKSLVTHKTVGRYVDEPTGFSTSQYYKYAVKDWEFRAIAGDFIDYKPYADRHIWTEIERKEFLILTVNGLSYEEIEALKEEFHDITDVKKTWTQEIVDGLEDDPSIFFTLDPKSHLAKRRMNIPQADLEGMGVDWARVQDLDDEYVPNIPDLGKRDFFDKMRDRKVRNPDGLNEYEAPRIWKGDDIQAVIDDLPNQQIVPASFQDVLILNKTKITSRPDTIRSIN